MISRREVLKMTAAGAFAAAVSRAASATAAVTTLPVHRRAVADSSDLARLTTAGLRALPPLRYARAIAPTGRTRTFTLTLATASVQPLPGHSVAVKSINGTSPGPLLRMVEGDAVEITVINRLARAITIHWHGIPVPFPMDGAGDVSQNPIQPGERFTYRWTAPQAGTYMYHAHFNDMQLENVAGMIVVAPQTGGREPRYDVESSIFITNIEWEDARSVEAQAVLANSMLMPSMAANPKADPNPNMGGSMDRMDMVEYWCFNGKTFPATDPIRVRRGDLVRVRFGNFTHMTHPMHLHGHWFRVIAQDGNPADRPQIVNTVPVHPGQTKEIDFIANNPGVWPLHCHILAHMLDNQDKMAGLMTVVQYEGYGLPKMMT
jgi:manganese oxidase